MFTGIIEEVGFIHKIRDTKNGKRFVIDENEQLVPYNG